MRRSSSPLERVIVYSLILLVMFFFLYPLWLALVGSIKSDAEILSSPVFMPSFTPDFGSWFRVAGMIKQPFYISLQTGLLTSLIGIVVGMLGGYCLSRKRGTWITILFATVLFGNYIPISTKILPALKIVQSVGLYDTVLGLSIAVGSMTLPICTLLFRQFLIQLPETYFEAADIEGADHIYKFTHIAAPLSKIPAFSVLVVTFAIGWNILMLALVLTTGPETTRPIGVTVAALKEYAEYYSKYNEMLAGGLLASIPVIALYIGFQRFVTSGFRSMGTIEK